MENYDLLSTSCEINLILAWLQNCAVTDTATQVAVHAQTNNPVIPATGGTTGSALTIAKAKNHVFCLF